MIKISDAIIWEKRDVLAHCESKSHLDQAKLMKSQTRLSFQKPPNPTETLKRTEAELQMAVLTATSNVPFSIHDRLRRLFERFSLIQK